MPLRRRKFNHPLNVLRDLSLWRGQNCREREEMTQSRPLRQPHGPDRDHNADFDQAAANDTMLTSIRAATYVRQQQICQQG